MQLRYDRPGGRFEFFESPESAVPSWAPGAGPLGWEHDTAAPTAFLFDRSHLVLVRGATDRATDDGVVLAIRSPHEAPIDIRVSTLAGSRRFEPGREPGTVAWDPRVIDGETDQSIVLGFFWATLTLDHRTGAIREGGLKQAQPRFDPGLNSTCREERAHLTRSPFTCGKVKAQPQTRGSLPACNLCGHLGTMKAPPALLDGAKHEMEVAGRVVELTFDSPLPKNLRVPASDFEGLRLASLRTLLGFGVIFGSDSEDVFGQRIGHGVARDAGGGDTTDVLALADALSGTRASIGSMAIAIGAETYGLTRASDCFLGPVGSDEMVVYRSGQRAALRDNAR